VRTLRALFSIEIVNRISGVGFTTPTIQVFNSSEERSAWELREQSDPIYLENPDAFARSYARWSVFGDLATQRTKMAAEHVSTAVVARDMLKITRVFGFDKLKYWGTRDIRCDVPGPRRAPCSRVSLVPAFVRQRAYSDSAVSLMLSTTFEVCGLTQ
jgi:hypothetical protein